VKQIDWPTDFWKNPRTDTDTDQYLHARDAASIDVYRLCRNRPIVAVSGSGKSHIYKSEVSRLPPA
jgi:hypothetical protein